MRLPFRTLREGDEPRPLARVRSQAITGTKLFCLLDTGSHHNHFGAWTAPQFGLDLTGAPETTVGIAGSVLRARRATVALELGGHAWEADVSFCDPWPWDHQILGIAGFFRFFVVTIDAANGYLDLIPNEG